MNKLKSILCLCLAAVMLCTALVGCSGSNSGTNPSQGDVSSFDSEEIPEKYEHLSANGITTSL